MSSPLNWTVQAQIVLREVWRGKVWTARPVTVVQDGPELIALYVQTDTRWKLPRTLDGSKELLPCLLPGGDWQLADVTWTPGDTLFLIIPGEAHAVHVMWGREDRKFKGWYINLQQPLRRTALGFDYMDQVLDIVAEPDLSTWHWKDEAEFLQAQEMGLFSPQQAAQIRAEGERVIERMRTKAFPFNSGWEKWQPPAEWSIPSLPDGWTELQA
jgi:hypothetical protein